MNDRWKASAKVAENNFLSKHPIRDKLARAKHLSTHITTDKRPQDAMATKLNSCEHFSDAAPRGIRARAPDKDKKEPNERRVQWLMDFDSQVWSDRTVVPGVSSVPSALVNPKAFRRKRAVVGGVSLGCSFGAKCSARFAGMRRLVETISLRWASETRVRAFADAPSQHKALTTVHAVMDDAVLRKIWDLIPCIVFHRVFVSGQCVFTHCMMSRCEITGTACRRWYDKPQ
ncbi:hypothetical protein TRVL_02644 [Trypanosoma vivax]|nr:hypothetical protein TRVL_02644 [Trypanosoma vivax]